jgi:hypothetical protein
MEFLVRKMEGRVLAIANSGVPRNRREAGIKFWYRERKDALVG